jgi:hypothetical protein
MMDQKHSKSQSGHGKQSSAESTRSDKQIFQILLELAVLLHHLLKKTLLAYFHNLELWTIDDDRKLDSLGYPERLQKYSDTDKPVRNIFF